MDSLNEIYVNCAENIYKIKLRYRETERYFTDYIVNDENDYSDAVFASDGMITIQKKYLDENYPTLYFSQAYIEYQALALPLFSKMLENAIVSMHGLGLLIKGKAWILTAPSGTGKTTQYLNWKNIDPDIEIINGDKLLLKRIDNEIQVFSSPYAGKENFHSNKYGILSGIIVLEQGSKNVFLELDEQEKISHLYPQILYIAQSEKYISAVCDMLTFLIAQIPIFKFKNTGKIESTKMLKERIKLYGLESN